MSGGANIRDIDALGDLKAAFGRFGEDVTQILPAIQRRFEEILEWLEERQQFWEERVDEARETLNAAERDLHDCYSSGGYWDSHDEYHEPDCSWAEQAVREARMRLTECEANLETVKQWRHRIESQIADFQNNMHRLSRLASERTGSAQAFLASKIEVLGSYVGGISTGLVGLQHQSDYGRIPTSNVIVGLSLRPVSKAFQLEVGDDLRDAVMAALDAIDSVHKDGALPNVPIISSWGDFYGYTERLTNSSLKIGINPDGPWTAMTTIHEIGHILDLKAMGSKKGFASHLPKERIHDVLIAAEETERIISLRKKLVETRTYRDRERLAGFLDPEEVWARAYTQFIAEKSGDARLKNELERINMIDSTRIWTTTDFVPIFVAIENLFRGLKWL